MPYERQCAQRRTRRAWTQEKRNGRITINERNMATCKCGSSTRARVIATLAAGSTTSPYYFQVNITKVLCKPTCASNVPVFVPAFTLLGFSSVGAGQYVATVRVQAVVTYDPCGTNCCSKSEVVSQLFTIPFASATAPTSVTLSQGATVNAIAAHGCKRCSRTFVSETPLTLTVA